VRPEAGISLVKNLFCFGNTPDNYEPEFEETLVELEGEMMFNLRNEA